MKTLQQIREQTLNEAKAWSWEKASGNPKGFDHEMYERERAGKEKPGDKEQEMHDWQGGGKYGPSRSSVKELWLICKDHDEAQDICDDILGSIMDPFANDERLFGSTIMVNETPINKNNEVDGAKGAKGPFNICAILGTKEHLKELLSTNRRPGGGSNFIPRNVRSQGLKDLRKAKKPELPRYK